MIIDWTVAMPATLDIMHLGLLGLSMLLVVVLVLNKNRSGQVVSESSVASSSEMPSEAVMSQTAESSEESLEESPEATETPKAPEPTAPESALQLLQLLQKEARFIDFVQEELQNFSDAEIGAAARVVHEGAKRTLSKHITLSPIRSEDEESRLTLDKGFDAQQVRLTGKVVGEAPYTGTLLHRGWRVERVDLPLLVEGHNPYVVAPAEVEL